MKRWERFNEMFGKNQTLEEQTVERTARICTSQLLDRIERSPVHGGLVEASEAMPSMEIYRRVKEWLQEEEPPKKQLDEQEATDTSTAQGMAEETAKRILLRLHDAGGCDARDDHSKGWDEAITEAIRIVEEETGTRIGEALD